MNPATSVPDNQLAKAFARDVKITIPCTKASAGKSEEIGHSRPTPMLSLLMSPPGKNSVNGRETKAVFVELIILLVVKEV